MASIAENKNPPQARVETVVQFCRITAGIDRGTSTTVPSTIVKTVNLRAPYFESRPADAPVYQPQQNAAPIIRRSPFQVWPNDTCEDPARMIAQTPVSESRIPARTLWLNLSRRPNTPTRYAKTGVRAISSPAFPALVLAR